MSTIGTCFKHWNNELALLCCHLWLKRSRSSEWQSGRRWPSKGHDKHLLYFHNLAQIVASSALPTPAKMSKTLTWSSTKWRQESSLVLRLTRSLIHWSVVCCANGRVKCQKVDSDKDHWSTSSTRCCRPLVSPCRPRSLWQVNWQLLQKLLERAANDLPIQAKQIAWEIGGFHPHHQGKG